MTAAPEQKVDRKKMSEQITSTTTSNNIQNKKMKKNTANTIFFRYTPSDSSITRKNFETYFSDIGPVKKCSLIRSTTSDNDKESSSGGNNRNAKGYGFCKFTCQDDAIDAANRLNESKMETENGITIKVWVELADTETKESNANQKKKRRDGDGLADGIPSATDKTQTTEDLMQLQAKKKTSRVILRNLSFYATEHNIRQIMEEKFGEVVEINLPLVPTIDTHNQSKEDNGEKTKKNRQRQQHRGFAFVTFANQKSANKAVEACGLPDTQILIKKRPVAIDFSVSKFQHRRIIEEEKNNDHSDDVTSNDPNNENSDDSGSSVSDGSESDSSDSSDEEEHDENSNKDDESKSDNAEIETDEKNGSKRTHHNSIFLRNLPFDTTRHDIFSLFAKYGRINGVFLVKDENTGMAKGTAFVQYEKEGGCIRALEASNSSSSSNNNTFTSGKNMISSLASGSGGIFLHGRRILVDMAVDKNTAETLKVQRDEDGKPVDKKLGKDKRNLYLRGEGRVEESGKESQDPNSWQNIPQSDQLKRGRAHQEKSTKLRSPLFFINPFRLSLRNLAKNIDETQLKHLVAEGIKNGLEKNLVSTEDAVAHWRAGGDLTTREIIEKLKAAENGDEDCIIPKYHESDGYKKYIPSVFIDRDFEVNGGKASKTTAPSRGFGFAEFTYHVHALACLRELNNNTSYSAEFVAGGKKALTMKKQMSSRKRKKRKSDAITDDEFLGEDGKVKVPRLIVEFTVENKAKARKQAERKAQQQANTMKQKAIAKDLLEKQGKAQKKEKKSRGAMQREKKRRLRQEEANAKVEGSHDNISTEKEILSQEKLKDPDTLKIQKAIKPPKKKKKIDKDENAFENMVRSYKEAFSGDNTTVIPEAAEENERQDIKKKRWFD